MRIGIQKLKPPQAAEKTSIDVNDVLYQLSQQTKSLGTKDSIA